MDLNIVCSFSRMKDLLKLPKDVQPSNVPSEKLSAVAEVLRSSSLVELNDSGLRLRRKVAVRDEGEISVEVDGRSLYARPLPLDATIDRLSDFFSQCGKVNCIRMRRHHTSKSFKGSIFVEFESKETADMVLSAASDLIFEGASIKLESKLAYMARNKDERKWRKRVAA